MISIIIPILNEASTIATTMQHVCSLYGNYEVIVIDGGSTDGTTDIAQRYGRVISSQRGRASQMNAGAKEARGDVLLFLHADTILPDSAMDDVEQCLADMSVIGGRFRLKLDENGWRYRMVASSINLRDRLINGFTGDQAIFIRTATFNELGGYREMPLMEDLDLGRRMCRAGKVVRLTQYVTTSARRWENNGVFRTVLLMWILKLLYFSHYPPAKLKALYEDIR